MIISLQHKGTAYKVDLSSPLDISTPISDQEPSISCFHAPAPNITPVQDGNFIGDTQQGGLVNFKNISFNPHGNGTHTECLGHITKDWYSINKTLKDFHFVAKLITVSPEVLSNGDLVITQDQIQQQFSKDDHIDALVIRTTPNGPDKLVKDYSGTNPTYLHPDATQYIVEQGIRHLLIDLPSVDKEVDGGKLSSHHTFWQIHSKVRTKATITELIYVDNVIKDGRYLLNLQIASFEMDASPSKPVLYKMIPS